MPIIVTGMGSDFGNYKKALKIAKGVSTAATIMDTILTVVGINLGIKTIVSIRDHDGASKKPLEVFITDKKLTTKELILNRYDKITSCEKSERINLNNYKKIIKSFCLKGAKVKRDNKNNTTTVYVPNINKTYYLYEIVPHDSIRLLKSFKISDYANKLDDIKIRNEMAEEDYDDMTYINEGLIGGYVAEILLYPILNTITKAIFGNKEAVLYITDTKVEKTNRVVFKKIPNKKSFTFNNAEKVIKDYCLKDLESYKKGKTTYIVCNNPYKEYYIYTSKIGNNGSSISLVDRFTLKSLETKNVKIVTRFDMNESCIIYPLDESSKDESILKQARDNRKEYKSDMKKNKISGTAWKFSLIRVGQMYRDLLIHPVKSITNDLGLLEKNLLKLVNHAKTDKDIKFLRHDASIGVSQLNKMLEKNLTLDNKTVDRYKDHIQWIKTEYKDAIDKKAKEIKENNKAKNESGIPLEYDNDFCSLNEIDTDLDLGFLEEFFDIQLSNHKDETLLESVNPTVNKMSKMFSDCDLYQINRKNTEEILFKYVNTCEHVDKSSSAFEDIKLLMKQRRVSNSVIQVMMSDKVILGISTSNVPLGKMFKIFTSVDFQSNDKTTRKVFVDVTGLIYKDNNGEYKCNVSNISILISHIISAAIQYIYYADPKRLIMNRDVINSGATCFAKLFTYVIDYLCKISVEGNTRNKVLYISALYYLRYILNKDLIPSSYSLARGIADLDEREANLALLQFGEENLDSLNGFFKGIATMIKREDTLTKDVIVNKWLFLLGVNTAYALELFPAFAQMLTNAYNGQFLNNQRAIETQCGQDMVKFCKSIYNIIDESV